MPAQKSNPAAFTTNQQRIPSQTAEAATPRPIAKRPNSCETRLSVASHQPSPTNLLLEMHNTWRHRIFPNPTIGTPDHCTMVTEPIGGSLTLRHASKRSSGSRGPDERGGRGAFMKNGPTDSAGQIQFARLKARYAGHVVFHGSTQYRHCNSNYHLERPRTGHPRQFSPEARLRLLNQIPPLSLHRCGADQACPD